MRPHAAKQVFRRSFHVIRDEQCVSFPLSFFGRSNPSLPAASTDCTVSNNGKDTRPQPSPDRRCKGYRHSREPHFRNIRCVQRGLRPERRIRPTARNRHLHHQNRQRRLRRRFADRQPPQQPLNQHRFAGCSSARHNHHHRKPQLRNRDEQFSNQNVNPAPRHPAIHHRRDAGTDQGSDDDERGRRSPLYPRHHRPPGRKQSRPTRDPRQQQLSRLLRQRRARRRAVLSRPLQPRSCRSIEGSQRHDFRPGRRRRRDQPRHQVSRFHAAPRSIPARRLVRQQTLRRRSGPAIER